MLNLTDEKRDENVVFYQTSNSDDSRILRQIFRIWKKFSSMEINKTTNFFSTFQLEKRSKKSFFLSIYESLLSKVLFFKKPLDMSNKGKETIRTRKKHESLNCFFMQI